MRRVREKFAPADMAAALEKESVMVALENLMTFPFVHKAVSTDMLTLHGLWTDIGEGTGMPRLQKPRVLSGLTSLLRA